MITKDLELNKFKEVEKETGNFQKSYGIGTCVFLDKPDGDGGRVRHLHEKRRICGGHLLGF